MWKLCYYPGAHSVAIKKLKLIKEQQATGLFTQLGFRALLSKILIFDSKCIKMNNIINRFLLAGDKFMPEMDSQQP